jgi:deoxycytidylate deaminase
MTNYVYDPTLNHPMFSIAYKKSNDPIRQVAAVLLTSRGNEYLGYNNIPDLLQYRHNLNTVSDYIWKTNRALGRLVVLHAEHTAILEAVLDGETDFSESILYVSLSPCSHCRQIIETAGIKTVFFAEHYVPST